MRVETNKDNQHRSSSSLAVHSTGGALDIQIAHPNGDPLCFFGFHRRSEKIAKTSYLWAAIFIFLFFGEAKSARDERRSFFFCAACFELNGEISGRNVGYGQPHRHEGCAS